MNPKEVKKWIANGIVAIAVNPFDYDSSVEYTAYERFAIWSFDQDNQPLTSLVGEFNAEDVEVVEKFEFRIWDDENEGWFDWVSSTQKYCETLTGTHETRQSYELIQKVKEVLQPISKMKTTESIMNYLVGLNGYPHLLSLLTRMPCNEQKQFITTCMQEYAIQQTEPLIKALKEINNISDWNDPIGKKVSKIVTKALKEMDK